MKRKYVSGPDGKWVEVRPRVREKKGPMVWNDLEDYKPIAGPEAEKFIRKSRDAKYVSGRKQHREYLKRNRLEEVGNELKYFLKHNGKTPDNPTVGWGKHGTNANWDTPSLERLMRGR